MRLVSIALFRLTVGGKVVLSFTIKERRASTEDKQGEQEIKLRG
jgi:hypothetical protein